MTIHDWQPAGTMSDGQRRYICALCRVGKTWPEALAQCGIVVEEAPRTSKKTIATVIAGRVPNRSCVVCCAAYYSQAGNSRYCAPSCARRVRQPETPEQRLERAERQWARRARGVTS